MQPLLYNKNYDFVILYLIISGFDTERDEIIYERVPNGIGHYGPGIPPQRILAVPPALP